MDILRKARRDGIVLDAAGAASVLVRIPDSAMSDSDSRAGLRENPL